MGVRTRARRQGSLRARDQSTGEALAAAVSSQVLAFVDRHSTRQRKPNDQQSTSFIATPQTFQRSRLATRSKDAGEDLAKRTASATASSNNEQQDIFLEIAGVRTSENSDHSTDGSTATERFSPTQTRLNSSTQTTSNSALNHRSSFCSSHLDSIHKSLFLSL